MAVVLTDFWDSAAWYKYEAAFGDAPGTRSRLLASAPWKTRLLDLRPSEAELWRGVRRSYHALINRLIKDASFHIVEAMPEGFAHVGPRLHLDAAGRVTRPAETWRVQEDWLRDGAGFALLAFREVTAAGAVEALGFSYVVTREAWAYHFSQASVEQNVGLALQWEMILRLKERGVERYELGWQGQADDEKGRRIEFARRGFGGEDVGTV